MSDGAIALLINNIGDEYLRFLPPLTITTTEIDTMLAALKKELKSDA